MFVVVVRCSVLIVSIIARAAVNVKRLGTKGGNAYEQISALGEQS